MIAPPRPPVQLTPDGQALAALAADIGAWVRDHAGDGRLDEAREIEGCARIGAEHPEIVLQPGALAYWRGEWETLQLRGKGETHAF